MNLYYATSLDAKENLAFEEQLLNEGKTAIFLWQSTPCVIVGRHQVIENEVEISAIPVFRRITGGGAVYMDEGNINIAFIGQIQIPQAVDIICGILNSLGLNATFSGRNDILVENKKISGWASIERNGITLCHGTLMFDVDLTTLENVLTPAKEKLERHGIYSVRSRVANLKEFLPDISFELIISKLAQLKG